MNRTPAIARLEAVLSQHPDLLARFAPSAPSAELEALRSAVGLPLPDDLLAFHAFRDGTTSTILGRRVLSCAHIVETKRAWDELATRYDELPPEERSRHWGHWRRSWVPILENDHEVVALATEACFDGPPGQIVSFDFKGGTHWTVEHASYADWIRTLSALAEEGLCDASRGADAVEELWRRLNPDWRAIAIPVSEQVDIDAGAPEPMDIPFAPGDAVKIVSGPFESKPAVFVEAVPDLMRIRVQVTVFGQSAVVEVSIHDVEVPVR